MKSVQELEREVIMERSFWSTSVCFLDVYHSAPQEFKDRIDKMDNKDLEKLINDNDGSWSNGLDAGLLTSADVVYRTLAENTQLPEEDEPDDEYFEKPWTERSGMKLNRKESK